jgi:hypothetical protein
MALLNMLSNSGLEMVVRLLMVSIEKADGYRLSSLEFGMVLSESMGA